MDLKETFILFDKGLKVLASLGSDEVLRIRGVKERTSFLSRARKGKGTNLEIPCEEILAVKKEAGGVLEIHYAKRGCKKKKASEERRNVWKHKTIVLVNSSSEVQVYCKVNLSCFITVHFQVLDLWRDSLTSLLSSHSYDRPRRLLVFINPYGGTGKASKIFHTTAGPLLSLSGISCEVVETERANHATDMLQSRADIEEDFDGVVCVGGDGMFNEIFNGMLRRTANANGIDKDDARQELTRPALR